MDVVLAEMEVAEVEEAVASFFADAGTDASLALAAVTHGLSPVTCNLPGLEYSSEAMRNDRAIVLAAVTRGLPPQVNSEDSSS